MKPIKYLDFNIIYTDDSFTSIHSLDKLFEELYGNEEFNKLIKRFYSKLDYQRRKEYRIKWQKDYDRKKKKKF